MPGLQEPPG